MASTSLPSPEALEPPRSTRRLTAGVVLLALLPVLLGVLVLGILRRTVGEQEHLADEYLVNALLTEELDNASNQSARVARDYWLTGDAAHVDAYERSTERVEELLARNADRGDAARRAEVTAERAAWVELRAATDRLIDSRRRGQGLAALEPELRTTLLPLRARVDALQARLRAHDEDALRRAQSATERAVRRTLWGLGAGVLGLALASAVLGLLVSYGVDARAAIQEAQRRHIERERIAREEADRQTQLRLALEAERDQTLALLDAIFKSAPVGLGFIDAELRYQRVNEPLAAMNGMPVSAHIGRTLAEILPRAEAFVGPLLQRSLAGELVSVEVPEPGVDPAHARHFLAHYFPVRVGGAVVGVGALIVDVTRMKHAEEQMRQAVEFRERFIGILGHDLRSPLNAITLSARVLLSMDGLPEAALRVVRRADASAARMARMIAELLDLTRIRLGEGLVVARQRVEMCSLCRDAVDELSASHTDADVKLECVGQGEGEWDADRLRQILSNLVGNAIKYGRASGVVTVRMDGRDEDEVVLSVHNEGEPIPEALLPSLFDPFRRGGDEMARGAREGLGLGLHIVDQIARAHGGRVEVTSTREEGTTFRVVLPRRAPASSP